MQVIQTHEHIQIREKDIIDHLIGLNQNNNTIAIQANELDVRFYATTTNHHGIVRLRKPDRLSIHQNDAKGESWFHYLYNNEPYRFCFQPEDLFHFEWINRDGKLINWIDLSVHGKEKILQM